MKIAFIIPSLKNSGGMERVMSQIVNYFAEKNADELHLVMFGPGCKSLFFKVPDSVTIHAPSFSYNDRSRNLYAIKAMAFIRKTIRSIKPDTILSFGEIWNSFVLLALLGIKESLYISDRCRPGKSFGRLHDTLRKLLYPRATGVVAQTKIAKEIYSKQFHHDNIVVIGNPIRTIAPNPQIQKENIVVSVGRLIDTKNFDQLIRIYAKINNPDWKLVIVGGDALKQHNQEILQKQIDEIGMQEHITLAGTQKDVESYLYKSKIFAFTSSSEGFPNVIGEAMSAGLPVVAYDCIAGPGDMIKDGENGFLIPLFDEDKFADKLSYLINHEDIIESMGQQANKSIQEFSVEGICQQYYSTLSKLIYE